VKKIAVLAALLMVFACASAQAALSSPYTNSVGLNIAAGTGTANGEVLAATVAGYTGNTQANWNNIGDGTNNYLSPTGAPVDMNNAGVTGLSVSLWGGWMQPDGADFSGWYGPGSAGDLDYIGKVAGRNLWDDYDTGPVHISVTGVPYTSYDVAVLTAPRDGASSWSLLGSGNISGDTVTYQIGGDQDRSQLYAFQILSMDSDGGGAVPEPAGLGLIGLALLAVRKRRS